MMASGENPMAAVPKGMGCEIPDCNADVRDRCRKPNPAFAHGVDMAQFEEAGAAEPEERVDRWWWDAKSPSVTTLNEKNFDDFSASSNFVVVEFYLPEGDPEHSVPSRKFAPVYEKLAKDLSAARDDISFGRVNCGSDQSQQWPPGDEISIDGLTTLTVNVESKSNEELKRIITASELGSAPGGKDSFKGLKRKALVARAQSVLSTLEATNKAIREAKQVAHLDSMNDRHRFDKDGDTKAVLHNSGSIVCGWYKVKTKHGPLPTLVLPCLRCVALAPRVSVWSRARADTMCLSAMRADFLPKRKFEPKICASRLRLWINRPVAENGDIGPAEKTRFMRVLELLSLCYQWLLLVCQFGNVPGRSEN
jgi:hypothetical protein